MSGVIKAGQGGRVRALETPVTPTPLRADPVADALAALRLENEKLRSALAERDRQIAAHPDALEQAAARATQEGRQAGLAERDDRTERALQRLDGALSSGLSRLAEGLAGLEPLALAIAEEALGKVLGDPGAQGEVVRRAIARQAGRLGGAVLLRIEVSRADFPEPEALASLAEAHPAVALQAVTGLASGEARLGLSLGGLEVGVAHQWRAFQALAARLAAEAGAA